VTSQNLVKTPQAESKVSCTCRRTLAAWDA
jgi:hypothetical protein